MNILFTLCGRAGSKGFKNKNLKTFLGNPLVYYSIAAIKLYMESEEGKQHNIQAVLNTDSEDLIQIVTKQNKVNFSVIEREAELGGDAVPKVAVIRDCLNRMEAQEHMKFDMVVDLDITSPLRTAVDVKNAIAKKLERKDTDVVFSVTDSRRNPYFNMVKQENEFFVKAVASQFTARQQAPTFFDMNASIYAYSVEALQNKPANIFFNDKCDAIVMKDTGVLDIDSEEDFELMQVIARYLFENDGMFAEVYETATGMK